MTRPLMRLAGLTVGLTAGLVLLAPGAASAHPLGNFTVNQHSGLVVSDSALRVDYTVDMAEIPSFQAKPQIDRNSDGKLAPAELATYAASSCSRLAGGLRAAADGRRLPLQLVQSAATSPAGQAGLPTLRLQCGLTTPLSLTGPSAITYRDDNFAGRVGWREITAAGNRTTIAGSDVPTRSVSAGLTAYPESLTSSPPDVRAAQFTVRPGGPALAGAAAGDAISGERTAAGEGTDSVLPRRVDRATSAFLGFVNRSDLSFGLGLIAVLLAVALGSLHALAPGHGKTVMAAYLVGRRGSLRTAATIGATVTFTHTAGVLVLGVALSVSTTLAPERLFPVMGLVSGLLLAVIGAGLLRSALRRGPDSQHGHSHGPHGHTHEPHEPHGHPHPHQAETPRRRSLIAMGFVGGLVPSPSALVVLLGAIAFERAWFGVLLVTAYGLGMAAALTLAGLLLVRARGLLERRSRYSSRLTSVLSRALPVGTAGVITLVGLGLALRGASIVVG